jgi:hypothetical protein
MRIFRVAARLVMCGSSVSMSWRAASTILPPALACAGAEDGRVNSMATANSDSTATAKPRRSCPRIIIPVPSQAQSR